MKSQYTNEDETLQMKINVDYIVYYEMCRIIRQDCEIIQRSSTRENQVGTCTLCVQNNILFITILNVVDSIYPALHDTCET